MCQTFAGKISRLRRASEGKPGRPGGATGTASTQISCTLILDTWNRLWSKVFLKKKLVQFATCITVHTYYRFGIQSGLHQFALFPTLSIFVFVQGERLDGARKFEVARRCRDVHKANL